MARPNKQGVDYFPLDVHLDDKFKFIEIKFGLEGFAIVIKLLQRIYSQGYWCKWTEDELLLFSDEIRTDCNKVEQVVNECLERDIFSKKLYEKYNILTSRGIQKRYKEIVRRRKSVEVTEEYLLIDDIFGVNDVNNPSSCQHDDSKSTQSKVNKSKVNKSNIPYAEIVSYLNEKTNSQYRHTTEKTKRCIKARWNEGFRLPDFKRVIDIKCAEWLNDPKMSKYLRPETLFGTKFESYLNQPSPSVRDPIDLEERRLQKERELFEKKIQMQRWVEAGNDPDAFVYQPGR